MENECDEMQTGEPTSANDNKWSVYYVYILTVRRENWNFPKVISFFFCLMQILCDFAEGSLPKNRFKPHFACIPHIYGI